jgi:hypothetical protein
MRMYLQGHHRKHCRVDNNTTQQQTCSRWQPARSTHLNVLATAIVKPHLLLQGFGQPKLVRCNIQGGQSAQQYRTCTRCCQRTCRGAVSAVVVKHTGAERALPHKIHRLITKHARCSRRQPCCCKSISMQGTHLSLSAVKLFSSLNHGTRRHVEAQTTFKHRLSNSTQHIQTSRTSLPALQTSGLRRQHQLISKTGGKQH